MPTYFELHAYLEKAFSTRAGRNRLFFKMKVYILNLKGIIYIHSKMQLDRSFYQSYIQRTAVAITICDCNLSI